MQSNQKNPQTNTRKLLIYIYMCHVYVYQLRGNSTKMLFFYDGVFVLIWISFNPKIRDNKIDK